MFLQSASALRISGTVGSVTPSLSGPAGVGVAGWVVVDDHDGARALTLKFALPVLRQGSLPLFREHRGYHSVSDIQRIVNGEKKLLQQ